MGKILKFKPKPKPKPEVKLDERLSRLVSKLEYLIEGEDDLHLAGAVVLHEPGKAPKALEFDNITRDVRLANCNKDINPEIQIIYKGKDE